MGKAKMIMCHETVFLQQRAESQPALLQEEKCSFDVVTGQEVMSETHIRPHQTFGFQSN